MKIQKAPRMFGLETGLPPQVVFTKSEAACLVRAGEILSAADDLVQTAGVDPDDYDTRGDLINGWDIATRLGKAAGFEFEVFP